MFHQKILIGLKVIDKYKLSKIEGFLRLFRKQGRNKKMHGGNLDPLDEFCRFELLVRLKLDTLYIFIHCKFYNEL